ncbi:MAG: GNAT family N-acetyltransferase [Microlunatus sp.]|nr:GNAT family N-acetyltransferase [Microlunatus sp.]
MEFRELREEDLGSEAWFGKIELRPDRWRDEHTRSAVAVETGKPIAAGIIWTSRIHPDRYWIDIVVDPSRRRHGIGTAMFGHLTNLRHDDLPFKTRGYVDEQRMAFANALGARTIQVVPPALIDVSGRVVLRPHHAVGPGGSVSWAKLLEANASIYEWIHHSWSPVAPGFAGELNLGLEDHLDLDATSVAVDRSGRIRAAAMAYRAADTPVVTAESVAPDDPAGERLVEGCIRATLDTFAERGISEVEFDGHVSDPHFLPVWARLRPDGRWLRLVEIPPAGDHGGDRWTP